MSLEMKPSAITVPKQWKSRKTFYKYLAVGGTSNIIAYSIYLVLTWQHLEPMLSMSIVYVITSIISFRGNYQWTFASKRSVTYSMPRYLAAQGMGYATNAVVLDILYYRVGMPHGIAELIGVGVVAIELFTINSLFVFK